jgi:hypothetical protein
MYTTALESQLVSCRQCPTVCDRLSCCQTYRLFSRALVEQFEADTLRTMGCAASAAADIVPPTPQEDAGGRFCEPFRQENFGGDLKDYQDGITAAASAAADIVPPTPQEDAGGRFCEPFRQENFGGDLKDYQDGITAMYAAPFPELLFEDTIPPAAKTIFKRVIRSHRSYASEQSWSACARYVS